MRLARRFLRSAMIVDSDHHFTDSRKSDEFCALPAQSAVICGSHFPILGCSCAQILKARSPEPGSGSRWRRGKRAHNLDAMTGDPHLEPDLRARPDAITPRLLFDTVASICKPKWTIHSERPITGSCGLRGQKLPAQARNYWLTQLRTACILSSSLRRPNVGFTPSKGNLLRTLAGLFDF